MPTHIGPAVRWTAVALLGGFAGWLGNRAGMPLPWILGPLVVAAAAALSGQGARESGKVRRAAQVVIGTAIGHSFSASVLAALLPLVPLMAALAVWSVAVAAACSLLLVRWTHLDPKSALLANLPGGVAEMAFLAEDAGKTTSPAIALIQTLRVASMVLIIPPLMALILGPAGAGASLSLGEASIGAGTAVVLAAGGAAGWLLQRIGASNPFIIGALLVSVLDTATGLLGATVSEPILILGQIVIGLSLGSRFRWEDMRRLPRVAATGLGVSLATSAVTIASALAMAGAAGLDPRNMVLAGAPGGMAEMVLTASALGLSVPLVACFQIVRILVVNSFAGAVAAGWERLCARFERNLPEEL